MTRTEKIVLASVVVFSVGIVVALGIVMVPALFTNLVIYLLPLATLSFLGWLIVKNWPQISKALEEHRQRDEVRRRERAEAQARRRQQRQDEARRYRESLPFNLYSQPWRDFRGAKFENFVGEAFRINGIDASVTQQSSDQGVDVVASHNTVRLAIQVKGYSGSVGNSAVQEVVAGMRHYQCQYAAVVTNSRFTKSAMELARSNSIWLISERDIEDLVHRRHPIYRVFGMSAEGFVTSSEVSSGASNEKPAVGIQNVKKSRKHLVGEVKRGGNETKPGNENPKTTRGDSHKNAYSVPEDVIEKIKKHAAKRHPNDVSTQRHIIEEELDAFEKLGEFSEKSVPRTVIDKLKRLAKRSHPKEFSTQLYILEEQITDFKKLRNKNADEIPEPVFDSILRVAEKDHPSDFSTQLYCAEEQVEAYLKLAHFSFDEMPDGTFVAMRANIEKDHPSDFSTQLHCAENQVEAYLKLAQLSFDKMPTGVVITMKARIEKDHPSDFSVQLYCLEEQFEACEKLSQLSFAQMPDEAVTSMKVRVEKEYPSDLSMQLYCYEEQIEAYLELNQISFGKMPTEIVNAMMARIEKEYPSDFSMQLYCVEEEIEGFSDS